MKTRTRDLPDPPAQEGWERITCLELIDRLHYLPVDMRWKWSRRKRDQSAALHLVEPGGQRWQFKLTSGAWIRRVP